MNPGYRLVQSAGCLRLHSFKSMAFIDQETIRSRKSTVKLLAMGFKGTGDNRSNRTKSYRSQLNKWKPFTDKKIPKGSLIFKVLVNL